MPRRHLPLVVPDRCPPPGERCTGTACRFHLSYRAGYERQGRRNGGLPPPDCAVELPEGTTETCALRIAASGPRPAREIAALMGCTRRSVQQHVRAAIVKLAARGVDVAGMQALLDAEGRGSR